MNDQQWQTHNADYLRERLQWLRSRLAGQSVGPSFVYSATSPTSNVPALELIQQRFGLSDFEVNCLFLCAAMEFDASLGELCAGAQGVPSRQYPTPALCVQLFADPVWNFLSPECPLRKFHLVDVAKHDGIPQLVSPLATDQRVIHYIRGASHRDERLRWYVMETTLEAHCRLSQSQLELVDQEVASLERSCRSGRGRTVIQLIGPNFEEQETAAGYIARAFGLRLLDFAVDTLPSQVDEIDLLCKLWNRERLLEPLGLRIDLSRECGEATTARLASFLSRIDGLVVITARDKIDRLPGASSLVPAPTSDEQRLAWEQQLPLDECPHIGRLMAGQYNLSLAAIDSIANEFVDRDGLNADRLERAVWDRCRAVCRPKLADLAQPIDSKATWSDLVLPAEQLESLRRIAAQVRYRWKVLDDWGFRNRLNRGLGITALFVGESGTGKTMAAEVIANDLRLDLFRIDLSSVQNKFIGETEKNLRKLFDAAESGGAILFFDEADALFGKRSEVKDSHDRYANLEVNYLLQRLETFRGLAILATNNRTNMDSAFVRRLRFVIDFPFPDVSERKEIWRRIFPREAPLSGFDAGHLAKLGIAGGNIHNIALNAAYAAAAHHDWIDMPTILATARSELIKTQKPLSVAGLQWPSGPEATS